MAGKTNSNEGQAKHNSGGQQNSLIRLILLVLAIVGIVGFLFIMRDQMNELTLIGILGVLAVVGVFYLFASIAGFVGINRRDQRAEIGMRFVETMPQGVAITDTKNVVVYSNAAYAALIGETDRPDLPTPEQVLSRHEDAANALYRLANTDLRGAPIFEEFRLPAGISGTDAHAQWYRVTVSEMNSPNATKLRNWRITNISRERERQEQYFLELQKAIDHLDRAPVGFFAGDEKGAIQYLNATLAEWLGIDLTTFTPGQMSIKDFLVGDGLALVNAIKAEPANTRTAMVDAVLSKANGESLSAQIIHRVQADKQGETLSTRSIVLNNAPTAGGAQNLQSAELRFTRFFNSTPMAIAALGADGRILRTNSSFANLFGTLLDVDELDRQVKFSQIIHERDRTLFDKAFEAAQRNQAKIDPFDTVVSSPGEERHIRIFVNAVAGLSGDVSEGADEGAEEAAIVYAMDTTEQKALEGQMAQSQKMQAVGQLAGGIAHDFNNVLTAIIMASDLLLTSHRPSDPSFADIMNIKQNANRAASLVRQLLAFSRRQTLRPEVLSLTDVLADLRMLLSRLIGNDIQLTIEHGRDLWPVKVDLGQFEQVIVNLTVNARDAMPDGGQLTIRSRNMDAAEAVELDLRGLTPEDFVLIEVTDTGTGIEPEVLEQIFEPFFTTKEVGKGTGLGLSMVYGIVKQTGGWIYAKSVVGEGTTFQILLPRHVLAEGESEITKPLVVTDTKSRDLSGTATVLLVEDEDAVRMGGVRALTSRGYKVHEAADGMEALDILEELEGKVDIVVSDVVMPELDGPSLLREIRKDYPDIKFIFVSGYAEDAFAKNLPEGAQFGFLPKPFSLKQLATTVKETLEGDF